MTFFSPHWLWGLVLLPILYFLICLDERRRQDQFARFADRNLWSFIAPEMNPNHRIRKARLWLTALGFVFLALARPQLGSHEETVQVSGLDIMLALDVSNSMNVEDVVPSRLQKAKHLIHTMIDQLNGDRVGVVAFAGSSYVACPLTTDLSYLWDTVQILGPKMIQNQGTDIGAGLDTALKAIERGAQEVEPSNPATTPSRVVILVSDGEDQEAQAMQIASRFKGGAAKLYILGVGTEKGGPIPIKDEAGNSEGYKKDRNGESIVSTFRPNFLIDVAKTAGGKYWNVTDGEAEVQELLQDLGALNRSDYAERRYLVYEDRFQFPLAIAIILLFFEFSIPARKILVIFLLFLSPMARAENLFKNPAPLGTYMENQKGIQAFKEGKIEEAQKDFGAAQARDPTRPELEFNQGVVQMQKGEVDAAIEAFKNSAQSSMQRRDSTLLGKSLYNLGNAFSKKGDVREAIRAYRGAIDVAEETKNEMLESESRKNLQLLINEVKKKQQQQQQQQKEQQQQQQKDQQQAQQQKEQQQQQQQQQQQKSGEEQEKQAKSDQNKDQKETSASSREQESQKNARKQQFQSRKMTPEDADRVMSELTTKERELQEKLQSQHAKSQDNPKDW